MKLTRLRASNFKSFSGVDVPLGNVSVFVGANASGKSNLLEILSFLCTVERFGLADAVSMKSGSGGIKWLRNVQVGSDEPVRVGFEVDFSPESSPRTVRADSLAYDLTFREPDQILEETVTVRVTCSGGETATYELRRRDDTLTVPNSPEDTCFGSFPGVGGDGATRMQSDEPVLRHLSVRLPAFVPPFSLATSTQVYDISPTALEGTGPVASRSRLESDGSNLPSVLRRILRKPDQARKFMNLLRALVPFARDVSVEQYTAQSLLVTLEESFSEGMAFPASLLSTGTMCAVALVVALYFDERPVTVLEEPARSLHPKLVARLVQMVEDAARNKQILLTTHNPEFLRHVDLEDVYFVSRDDDGFSQVTRPKDSEMVQAFLGEELGLNDLFVDDLLNV